MANPRQIALQRKLIYFGIILVLFTVSLIHRKWVVEPQAFALQLREVSRGEVELTGSTVRLLLTGSRGLATTLLWYQAMEKQKRNEWHELELVVQSITKLQPYFITPWLYQSWNISFNVAVECDQPRDKYYYISRGLELLSEGERRNRGVGDESLLADGKAVVFPGHPEMRHYMGFTYQLKIGTSDERLTMRSLLELSCIDPVERNAQRFLRAHESGPDQVDLAEFSKFCKNHPRLVRRLREQLTYVEPMQIVRFLRDHEKIPSRYKAAGANARESELKDPLKQFPILPPQESHWPNPKNPDMTRESVDVFLVCRTWYEFAQKPLPPPEPNPTENTPKYDPVRYRVPRQMVTQIFRQYPARAEVYIAETLESEGWFDSEGWEIRDWFDDMPNRVEGEENNVGKEPKYHSRLAWKKGFEAYHDFGVKNGVYLTPREIADLNKKAEVFRKAAGVGPGEIPPLRQEWLVGDIVKGLDAQIKLKMSNYYRGLCNFDGFYYQAEGESDPLTVTVRKYLFSAERKRKSSPSELMLRDYETAWGLYFQTCLKYPHFAQVSSMQEDFYEIYQQYLGKTQELRSEQFKKKSLLFAKLPFGPVPVEVIDPSNDEVSALAAQMAYFLMPSWRETIARQHWIMMKERDPQVMNSVPKMKKRTGVLDQIQYYDGPAAKDLRPFLLQWTQLAGPSANLNMWPTVVASFPGHEYYLLTRRANDIETWPEGWRPLITGETRRITANRLGLDR